MKRMAHNVWIDAEDMVRVYKFTYLRSIVSETGVIEENVTSRIAKFTRVAKLTRRV